MKDLWSSTPIGICHRKGYFRLVGFIRDSATTGCDIADELPVIAGHGLRNMVVSTIRPAQNFQAASGPAWIPDQYFLLDAAVLIESYDPMQTTCGARFKEFSNELSTAAFCVINSGWYASPGAIFPDIVDMYRKDTDMKHIMFTTRFLWDELKASRFYDKTVGCFLFVPISENESEFAKIHGSDALEDLFVEKQIDIFNLDRSSVI